MNEVYLLCCCLFPKSVVRMRFILMLKGNLQLLILLELVVIVDIKCTEEFYRKIRQKCIKITLMKKVSFKFV